MTTKKRTAAPAATKKTTAVKTRATKISAAKPVEKNVTSILAKPAPAPAAKKAKKEQKGKVVRDSFTMPQSEYRKIADIKESCLKAGLHVKKSEILRAGLKELGEMSATQLKQSLSRLEKIRTGRPKKHKD